MFLTKKSNKNSSSDNGSDDYEYSHDKLGYYSELWGYTQHSEMAAPLDRKFATTGIALFGTLSKIIKAPPCTKKHVEWKGIIKSPEDTKWERRLFNRKLVYSGEYPYKSPDERFVKKIFNENVDNDKTICIKILNAHQSYVHYVSEI